MCVHGYMRASWALLGLAGPCWRLPPASRGQSGRPARFETGRWCPATLSGVLVRPRGVVGMLRRQRRASRSTGKASVTSHTAAVRATAAGRRKEFVLGLAALWHVVVRRRCRRSGRVAPAPPSWVRADPGGLPSPWRGEMNPGRLCRAVQQAVGASREISKRRALHWLLYGGYGGMSKLACR